MSVEAPSLPFCACSGAIHMGEPTAAVVSLAASSLSTFEMPKSRTFTVNGESGRDGGATRMFWSLRSRCTTPMRCAAPRPWHI